MQNIYGVLVDGVHVDVSLSEKGAKRYATLNNYLTVTIRYGGGYTAACLARKVLGKWVAIN